MPVKLLSSSILKWPEPEKVIQALRIWVKDLSQTRHDIVRIGYFGSYAVGNWGCGSDLDVVIVVTSTTKPFELRGVEFDTGVLPVAVDLLVYTEEEWKRMTEEGKALKGIVWLPSDS